MSRKILVGGKAVVRIPIDGLREANAALRRTVNPRHEVEDLRAVCIQGRKGGGILYLSGTDMYVFSRVRVPAEVRRSVLWLVPYQELGQFIEAWRDDVLVSEGSGDLMFCSGADRLTVPLRQGEREFVERFPTDPEYQLRFRGLPRMVAASYRMVNPTHNMASMCGVHLVVEGERLTVEASDGFSYVQLHGRGKAAKKSPSIDVVMHVGCGQLLPALPRDAYLGVSSSYFFYRCRLGSFGVNLMNVGPGEYNDLGEIPRPDSTTVDVPTSELSDAVRKIRMVGGELIRMEPLAGGIGIISRGGRSGGPVEYEGHLGAEVHGTMPPKIYLPTSFVSYLLSLNGKDDERLVLHMGTREEEHVWYESGDKSVRALSVAYVMTRDWRESDGS